MRPGILSAVQIFRALPSDAVEDLASRGTHRRFDPGAVIMRQGDPSPSLFVIVSGRVRVDRKTEDGTTLMLAELGPNEVAGEMGVLDGEPRTATVTAIDETHVLELPAGALAIALVESPSVSAALLRLLSRRLRNTDELIDHMSQERRGGR